MISLPLPSRICWTAFTSTSRYSKCKLFPSWKTNFGYSHHHCQSTSTCESFKSQNGVREAKNATRVQSEKQKLLKTSQQQLKLTSAKDEIVKKSKYEDELLGWAQIYRCDKIVAARVFQRFKIGQTIFTILIAVPLSVAGFIYHIVDVNAVYIALGGSIFASTMLYVAGNFFSRLIGHVYVSKTENPLKTVRIARLDFWGGRVDEFVPIKDIVPLSEYVENYNTAYVKVKQYTDDDDNEAYNITFQYGTIIDAEKFELIFGGLP